MLTCIASSAMFSDMMKITLTYQRPFRVAAMPSNTASRVMGGFASVFVFIVKFVDTRTKGGWGYPTCKLPQKFTNHSVNDQAKIMAMTEGSSKGQRSEISDDKKPSNHENHK